MLKRLPGYSPRVTGFSSRQQGFETPRERHFFPQYIQLLTPLFRILASFAKAENRGLCQFVFSQA